jgi:hypothetical protein
MTIVDITEIENKKLPKQNPIKEKMDIYVPNIAEGLSRRNGMIYGLIGAGGSGKTNLLLNLFKSTKYYKSKFHNIWYICPSSSFDSIEKHPLDGHDKVHHELTVGLLDSIYNQLMEIKKNQDEVEYSCVVLDDQADSLKDKDILRQLNKMLIKARHLQCGFIFTLQGYYYMPKILRKQFTYVTMFKTNNAEEYSAIVKEVLHMNSDDSLILYDYVYDRPYAHLDVDLKEDLLYKNFNLLEIETSKSVFKK